MCEKKLYPERKNIPLKDIIYEICGKQVIPINMQDESDKRFVCSLYNAAQKTVARSKETFIIARRANEVGNKIEPIIKTAISEEQELRIGRMSGHGYPDLLVYDQRDRPSYVEIKTFNFKNIESSFRSFYFSPSKNFKIILDARHLVVSFQTKKHESQNTWSMKSFKILDVTNLPCTIKYEWNSNNKNLYDPSLVLREGD